MTLPFSTAVARWQLDVPLGGATARRRLNSELYTAAVAAYDRVQRASRAAGKSLTTTELNHALFRWQMAVLDKTGDYWEGFTKLPVFRPLMRSMQAAAAASSGPTGATNGGSVSDRIGAYAHAPTYGPATLHVRGCCRLGDCVRRLGLRETGPWKITQGSRAGSARSALFG